MPRRKKGNSLTIYASEASELLEIKDGPTFEKMFFETGIIDTIIFPGQTTRRYVKKEVLDLLEKNKYQFNKAG